MNVGTSQLQAILVAFTTARISYLCYARQNIVERSTAMKKRSNSIRKQIMLGYSRIILVVFLLVALLLVSLFLIRRDYRAVSRSQDNRASTQAALAKHYEWLELFSESLQDGSTFQGSLDHNTCLLGQWIAGVNKSDLSNPSIARSFENIQDPH